MAFSLLGKKSGDKKTTVEVETSHDSVAPHVIDLGGGAKLKEHQNSLPKNAVIMGFLVTLVLAVFAVILGFFLIRQRTTTPPKAASNPFACTILVKPNPNKIEPGMTKTLEGLVEGQTGKVTYTWKLSTENGEKGSFSDKKINPTKWTAPDDITKDQSWRFNLVVIDATGTRITCQRVITTDKSEQQPVKMTEVVSTNGRGSEAKLQVSIKNLTAKEVNVEIDKVKNWCLGVAPPGNFGNAATICGENTTTEKESFAIPANGTKLLDVLSQSVGNNGKCGSAQVDINTKVDGKPLLFGNAAVALLDACTDFTYQVCETNNACSAPKKCPVIGVDCRAGIANKCTTDAQCQPQVYQYKSCDTATQACTSKNCPTPGVDCSATATTCTSDAACKVYQYKSCDTATQACTSKNCPTIGTDCSAQSSCTDDNSCKTYQYKTCENQACVTKNCNPTNQSCSSTQDCSSDNDCQSNTHKVCINQACSSVACPNNQPCSDECTSNSSCQPQTHYACVNQACQLVSGAGANQCSTNAQCAPSVPQTHKACVNQACQVVSGGGSDSCSSNADCTVAVVPPAATHRACVNQACQVVSGAGADTCTSDVTCRPVAVAPPIPQTGSTEMTIGAIILGIGVLAIGALFAL